MYKARFRSNFGFRSLVTILLLTGLFFTCNCQQARAQDDLNEPDSVYYHPFGYRPNSCTGQVSIRIPVYLSSDGWANFFYALVLRIEGYSGCDSAVAYYINPCSLQQRQYICGQSDTLCFDARCYSGQYLTPGSGIVGEFFIRGWPGDTITLSPMQSMLFTINNFYNQWYPLYLHLDTSFVVPAEFDISPGDADASGTVTISDAVFLINYIFAGGCQPWDQTASDADNNCLLTISDVVYLINYIFAAGNPPLGCSGTL